MPGIHLSRPVAQPANLEAPLLRVETGIADLGEALSANDSRALEVAAGELQRAWSGGVDEFRRSARLGRVHLPMRQRLATASAKVAAQREALARATAALDRAIDVLIPGSAGAYGMGGAPARVASRGSMVA